MWKIKSIYLSPFVYDKKIEMDNFVNLCISRNRAHLRFVVLLTNYERLATVIKSKIQNMNNDHACGHFKCFVLFVQKLLT